MPLANINDIDLNNFSRVYTYFGDIVCKREINYAHLEANRSIDIEFSRRTQFCLDELVRPSTIQ